MSKEILEKNWLTEKEAHLLLTGNESGNPVIHAIYKMGYILSKEQSTEEAVLKAIELTTGLKYNSEQSRRYLTKAMN